ncbi:MAG TPA: EAL domain-containing protein [Granulicella sp.]
MMDLPHGASDVTREFGREPHPLMPAVDAIDTAILILDRQQNIVHLNRAFTDLFGYTLEDLIGSLPTRLFSRLHLGSAMMQSLSQAASENRAFQEETLLYDKSGREVWVSASVSPMKEDHGSLLIVLVDVTETKQIQRLQRTVLEAVAGGMPLAEVASLLCDCVDAITPEVISSMVLVDGEGLIHPLAGPRLPPEYAAALEGLPIGENAGSCGTAAFRGEAVCVTDISTDPLWERYKSIALPFGLQACWSLPIRLRSGRIAGTFAFYFTEKRTPSPLHKELAFACLHLCMLAIESDEARQKIVRLSQFDPLTGLLNRTSLYEQAGLLLTANYGRDVGFFCIDLDYFKDINNTLGHAVGDRVLTEMGYRLQELAQPQGIASRDTGDSFVIVAPHCSIARASALAGRMLEALCAPVEILGFSLSITASIGICITQGSADPGETAQVLAEQARMAMRQAKSAGRACFHFYHPEMNLPAQDRLILGTALRLALSSRSLRLEYQPKVDLRTLRLTGVEALSRWTDDRFGEISPEKFIPLAEEISQIEVIGIWSLREACRQMAEWRSAGVPVPSVSVNLAPVHFLNRNLPAFVADLLREFQLPAECLTIEITESIMASKNTTCLETATDLHAIGVALSIDDFGTGFSSLARLTQLPLKELKLDRSFIQRLESDASAYAVATAVIAIGRNLGMTVVSEGVETERQAQLLIDLGCQIAQGFFFARAMPAQQLESWIQSN